MPQAAIPIAASVAGSLASKALAGKAKANIPEGASVAPPVSLATGGLSLTNDGGRGFTATRSPQLQSLIDQISGINTDTADQLGSLLPILGPGYGAITDARVNAIRDKATSSISDLRDNLSRRRILGSSFAQDSLGRVQSEFAKAEGEAKAQSFLEELDATTKLITQRGALLSAAAEKQLSQLNLDFQQASNLINGTQQVLASNAQALADIAVANASGAGAGNAGIVKSVSSGVDSVLTDIFK